ncbi:LuxR C-terminal-related transcriptional regulator [Microbispora bryophytorum]|uniref:LuxR C-terminal-related transcriptional regulator n=1 Tax=Microbispora bryophytorum TaxID=1460882 RepID=UPI0033F51251
MAFSGWTRLSRTRLGRVSPPVREGPHVRLWHDDLFQQVDTCIARARSAQCCVLVVDGEPGSGKTTLLEEIAERAEGFTVLSAEGLADDSFPFSVLLQWGVDLPPGSGNGPVAPFVAAQHLRERLDQVAFDQPVLLCVDDLQWADDESVNALAWLVTRALADRLLVAVGVRRVPRGTPVRWQRLRTAAKHFEFVELGGLSVDQVHALVTARGRHVPREVAANLHRHTDGNPLYVTALLDEHDPADLAGRELLPAPAAFADAIRQRTARLPDPVLELLRLCAVWGSGWLPLPAVAGLMPADSVTEAVEVLAEHGLLSVRAEPAAVRVAHALIRAAIYEQTPLGLRRALHERIANATTETGAMLDHRLAAASAYDDVLADALDAYAQTSRRRHDWRQAARYLRGAGEVTSEPKLRRRRHLDSLLATALVPDVESVRSGLTGLSPDDPNVIVVRALAGRGAGLSSDPIAPLRGVLERTEPDDVTRYRAGVLLADAMLRAGTYSADETHRVLAAAEALGVADPYVLFHARSTRTFVDQHRMSPAAQWATVDASLGDPAAVPAAAGYELGRRATIAVRVGLYEVALADLQEMVRRLRSGELSQAEARALHGLGFVQWLTGDWQAARISMNLGTQLAPDPLYPLYLLIGDGRFEELDAALSALDARRDRISPITNSNRLHLTVLRAHASADRGLMRAVGERERGGVAAVLDGPFPPTVLWLLSAGVAALWGDAADLTARCADALEAARPTPTWAASCASWLRALIAEHRGQAELAASTMDLAMDDSAMSLPLFRAHMQLDHARMAGRAGRTTRARESLEQALSRYRRLGATPYVERITAQLARPPAPTSPAVAITDRERDVLTLLVAGMSYAQIASELFISQKTVGYHLSNMYAKADVSGRHQLSDLARRQPELFRTVAA